MGDTTGRSFGAALRAAREKAGLDLEGLAAATRVPQRYLEALEEEQWGSLPGGVTGRGFVRLAARELGLPVDDLLPLYREARGGEETEVRLVSPQQEWTVDFRRDRSPGPVLLGILLLLGAALGVWVWSPWSVERTVPTQGPAPAEPAPPAAPSLPSLAPPADAPGLPAAVDPEPPAPAVPVPAPPPVPEVHRLEILALEGVWVRVVADGGPPDDRLLQPGQRQAYEIRRGASVRLGNAGGVRLTWNGEALKVPGPRGAVMNLVFPGALEGLRP